eukprot:TRINITY_DN11448_c0_g1_i11.p1 TRINITY_DN11448_c0_g1~~TRINITY_DN11448_c0_g1_i11.p1  ORF type:complete len:752 (+),score=161.82 TRINITY_DN11448_c0_g1_i11:80-2335(+)
MGNSSNKEDAGQPGHQSEAGSTPRVASQGRNQDGRPAPRRPRAAAIAAPYAGHSEFKEALYMPVLSTVDAQVGQENDVNVFLPLLDVSGSMHNKLLDVKKALRDKFLYRIDPNVGGLMVFTDKPHIIANISHLTSAQDRQQLQKAIKSLFIPAHSGTDIPAAVFAFLSMLDKFFQTVPARKEGGLWKATGVIITDGIHKIAEKQWTSLREACQVTREAARSRKCIVFFYILNLRSKDVDAAVLQRLADVLQAERADSATMDVPQVCDTVSRHMVTLERCVTEVNEIKKEVAQQVEKNVAKFRTETLEKLERVSDEVQEHEQSVHAFQPRFAALQAKSRMFTTQQIAVRSDYQVAVVAPTAELVKDIRTLGEEILEQQQQTNASLRSCRELFATQQVSGLVAEVQRVGNRIARVHSFVGDGRSNSQELRAEVACIVDDLEKKAGVINAFAEKNKGQQHTCRIVQAQAQQEREKAHKLQQQLLSMRDDFLIDGPVLVDMRCEICTMDGTLGIELSCKAGHAFCASCLTKHVDSCSQSNRAALCPKCPHELFENEVEHICEVAGKADIADVYLKRCMQRRVESKASTLFCPKGCGNAICSQVGKNMAVCDKCRHRFCPQCAEAPHPQVPSCQAYIGQRLKQLEGPERARLAAIAKNLEFLEKDAKTNPVAQCPKCEWPCQKTWGCDSMVCGKCRHRFDFSKQRVSSATWASVVSEALTDQKNHAVAIDLLSNSTTASADTSWRSLALSLTSLTR